MLRDFPVIAIPYPQKQIFVRLGGNLHRTTVPQETAAQVEKMGQAAFAVCHPRGRYAVLAVPEVREDAIRLETDDLLRSCSFAKMCRGCIAVWCAAVTIGAELTAFRDAQENVSEQAICDAVGSESAEATMDFLHQLARRELLRAGLTLSEHRFSAGYGDMKLDTQWLVNKILQLSQIGIQLTETAFMLPEKSVTAWAPIFQS